MVNRRVANEKIFENAMINKYIRMAIDATRTIILKVLALITRLNNTGSTNMATRNGRKTMNNDRATTNHD